MNKTRIVILLTVYLLNNTTAQSKILKKVIIFSRHNIRAPYTEQLEALSPKQWPEWIEESTHLTAKGVTLEGYMGEYFGAWLRKEQVLSENCPNDNDFFAYANLKQRTKASAKAFIETAFPSCNLSVNVTNEVVDLTFSPVIHNNTKEFSKQGIQEMNEKMNELQRFMPYKYLEEILDFKSSKKCQKDKVCDLEKELNALYIEIGNEPDVFGPLNIAKTVADAFVLEYYEGKEVAWGQIKTDQQWKNIMKCLIIYHDIKFNTTLLANDISRPMIQYMKEIWNSEDNKKRMTLLMGHDANIITILKAMNFKSFTLPNQLELTPIGGKLVFQKWFDIATNESYLKIDYVYQSTDQLRDGKRLTLDDPPQWYSLILEECETVNETYCKWSDFQKILDRF